MVIYKGENKMKTNQELAQISVITERAIRQLKCVQRITGLSLDDIKIALYELQDGIDFMKERLNKC